MAGGKAKLVTWLISVCAVLAGIAKHLHSMHTGARNIAEADIAMPKIFCAFTSHGRDSKSLEFARPAQANGRCSAAIRRLYRAA